MSLYTIADLHLSLGTDKPMDVFGGVWKGYWEKLSKNLEELTASDTLVIVGDLSWGISMKEAKEDFKFLSGLPCEKILVKGNHDLWWCTVRKMERFFEENDMHGFKFLHNNCLFYGDTALCGTRGWFFEEEKGDGHDAKMMAREIGRLKTSLEAAKKAGAARIYCFMHYPPLFGRYRCDQIISLLGDYGVERLYYGHLHGASHRNAFQGVENGVKFTLVAADYVGFQPILVIS